MQYRINEPTEATTKIATKGNKWNRFNIALPQRATTNRLNEELCWLLFIISPTHGAFGNLTNCCCCLTICFFVVVVVCESTEWCFVVQTTSGRAPQCNGFVCFVWTCRLLINNNNISINIISVGMYVHVGVYVCVLELLLFYIKNREWPLRQKYSICGRYSKPNAHTLHICTYLYVCNGACESPIHIACLRMCMCVFNAFT